MTQEEANQTPEFQDETVSETQDDLFSSNGSAAGAEEVFEQDERESTEITEEERHEQLKAIAEALIFATNEPLTEAQFLMVAGRRAKGKLADLVAELNAEYVHTGRAFEILHIAQGFQFYTRPEYAHSLKKLFTERSRTRLSRAALESLAVVAFRGPVTRAEIDEIRGVESSGVMRTLLDRRLVKIKGRAEVIGRPMLYETTEEFMHHFGLSSLDDLPKHHELTREWGELQNANIDEEADEYDEETGELDADSEHDSELSQRGSGEAAESELESDELPSAESDKSMLPTDDQEHKPSDSGR